MIRKRKALATGLILVVVWLIWNKGSLGLTRVDDGPQLEVASAVMMDAETGKWLYRSHAKEPLPPASMSKMMTEVLVLESTRSGDVGWDDLVMASDYAAHVGGAGMGLAEGSKTSVKRLFNAMAIHSANDAAVSLAEYVAGTEAEFVVRMNKKAAEIGLSAKTRFANATGLPSSDLEGFATASADYDTVMTAEDVAILGRYLIETYPEVLMVTKKQSADDSDKGPLQTTNEMLPGQRFGLKGNEGLKTGYTKSAGYCFTGSTVINGRRYITVVMGASTAESRFTETKKLLDYAKEAA
ncbi:D-alanyl-D-alanine carboxypeptidase [Cohnella endophytica]|uniref:D-alanyl-D-alanine carboxypeptidase n=1 Tax=Cohnella endophytica TaxID=2419778 RepID=A0A494Y4D1_9BACL|nr:D-alanyl-D-alanine carboxypeptidase family protein [Cohnella endophytica]RKP57141.1 D-alanyl-D-alanine carboxypeptidase [Cohnella endophytica]